MMVVKLSSAVGDDGDEKGSRDKRRRWDGDGDAEMMMRRNDEDGDRNDQKN